MITNDLIPCLTYNERWHLVTLIYSKIQHGDEAHKKWLFDTLEEIFDTKRSDPS